MAFGGLGSSLGGVFQETLAGPTVTRAAPTTSTEGLDLKGVAGFRVLLSADSGQLLLGAGAVDFYLWSPTLQRWCDNFQLQTLITPSGATWANRRDIVIGDFDVQVRAGRVVAAPRGVTVDAGSLTVTIEPWQL